MADGESRMVRIRVLVRSAQRDLFTIRHPQFTGLPSGFESRVAQARGFATVERVRAAH
jgi:hypothetical protein